jgi:two-component system sensor histidine kinase BaeS
MKIKLWMKIFILMMIVVVLSLSSGLIGLVYLKKDFQKYQEGQKLNQIYWIIDDLENTYKNNSGWKSKLLEEDIAWIKLLGFEIILKDQNNKIIINTFNKNNSSVLYKKTEQIDLNKMDSYTLFANSENIGTLYIVDKDDLNTKIFKNRIIRFFIFIIMLIAVFTFILSLIFSRKLSKPINRLADYIKVYSKGEYPEELKISGNDEIAQLTSTFNEMGEALKKYESLRKKILTNVAHELRTPLTSIRGEIEGIIDGVFEPNDERLESILEEIHRLESIIVAIESLSRAEATSVNIKKEFVDFKSFIDEIILQFEKELSEKDIFLNIDIEDNLMIYVDKNKFKQVIINLISNAIKATEGGQISIIGYKKEDSINIFIKDSGKGISEKDLPYIFERFYSGFGSIGVGLAIVKEIVEAHKGDISVESDEGKMTEFRIVLPLL